jgi:hypothetical protein
LISRAAKKRLMAEEGRIGNDLARWRDGDFAENGRPTKQARQMF